MNIRSCAMENDAFLRLKHVYENREEEARKARATGKKVIATLGCDVPDEILLAAGFFPVRVYADEALPLTETDKYLEYAFDPMVRAQFEKIVNGTYAMIADGLVISNSTDVLIRTYLYLRELKRVEPEKPVPEIAFIDWLFTRKQMHFDRNVLTMKIFRDTMEKWAGHRITDVQIRRAAALVNANRAALKQIEKLRAGRRITGTEALIIIGAGFFMEKEEHTACVLQIAKDAAEWPVVRLPRVFFTGSNQETPALYSRIEEEGAVIVSEDHDWGNRSFAREFNVALEVQEALVDCYMFREFSSKKAFVDQRIEALKRETDACKPRGVLFYTNVYEEAASWDYPGQKVMLEQQGIATCGLFRMKWPYEETEQTAEALKGFIKSMKGGKR